MKVSSSLFDSKINRVRLQDAQSKWKEQPRECLPASTHSDHMFIYADYLQVYTNCTTSVNTTLKLKSEAEEMYQWYNANLLNANPNKYHVLAINPK